MKIHRFYVPDSLQKGARVMLPEALSHQVRRVLRLVPGEKVELFCGDGKNYSGTISEFLSEGVSVQIEEVSLSKNIPKRNLTLAVSIPKKDTFEWILEKGTELGVSQFIPILSSRSEKKEVNSERAEKIIIEASEQSGRATLPKILSVTRLQDFNPPLSEIVFAFHTTGEPFNPSLVGVGDMTALIGPEGGWSPEDLAFFAEKKIPVVCLGVQILRVETAAVAITSLMLL